MLQNPAAEELPVALGAPPPTRHRAAVAMCRKLGTVGIKSGYTLRHYGLSCTMPRNGIHFKDLRVGL